MHSASISLTSKELHQLVENWQLPPDDGDRLYPVNTVVDAYLKGKNDGIEQTNKLFRKQLQDNLAKAGGDTSKVISFLRDKGINPISAHLKLCSLYDINVLITVSEEDFLKDSFSEIYSFTNHIEQIEENDLYSISFSFIDRSAEFNAELLQSDGYALSFKGLSKP